MKTSNQIVAYIAYAAILMGTLHLVSFESAVVIGLAFLMAKEVES